MSRIRTNLITNRMANGAPTVSNGLVISGVTTTSDIKVGTGVTLNVYGGATFSGIVTASSFSGIDTDKISEGNTEAEVVDTGSDGHFKVTTEGGERLRITSAGLVGIGTEVPTTKLHIFGSSADPYLRIGGGGRDCGIQLDANTNFTAFRTDAANRLWINAGADGINFTVGGTTSGNQKLRIDSSGNFNLGLTASPVSSSTEQGVFLAGANSTQSVISSDVTALVVNRVGTGGNDRNCIEFRNNGVLRGTIGAIGGSNGIFFQSGTTEVLRIHATGAVTQPYLPSFMAYGNSSYTTINSGANLQPYVFPNTAHNTGSHYNTSNGKFTAPVTGVYQLNWNIFCKSDTNQTSAATLEFYVVKNGSTVSRLHNKKGYGNMGDDQQIVNLHVFEKLNANDEISINAYAYNVAWKIYGAHSTFSGALIG